MGETKKAEPDLQWWTPQASQTKPHKGQDIENCLSDMHPKLRPRGLTSHLLKNSFFKIPDLVHRPTAAAVAGGNCR